MNINPPFTKLRRKFSQSNAEAKRNPWFIGWMVLLAVVLGVNALFVVLAIGTNPGLVVPDYYEQGRQYEQHALERITARKNLRWTTRLEIPLSIVRGIQDDYRFHALDVNGVPINSALVKLLAYRPSDATADFVTTLQESTPGSYEGMLRFPLPGVWDLKVEVQSGADQYELTHRIFVLNTPDVQP